MTKNELWRIYVKRNPSFEGDGNVTMSAKGLRKLFDTTWDTAYYDGESEPVENTGHSFQQDSQGLNHLMSIFGMK
jgi:hypothetical protein